MHASDILAERADLRAVEPMMQRTMDLGVGTLLAESLIRGLAGFGAPALELLVDRLPGVQGEDAHFSAACLLGDLAVGGHTDRRGFEFLLRLLDVAPDSVAGSIASYGDPSALSALSAALDAFVPIPDASFLTREDAVELRTAIEELGGSLTPDQQEKIRLADEPRRAFFEALGAGLAVRAKRADPPTGDGARGDGRGGRSGSKSRSKSKRKMKGRSRRRNR